MKKILFTVFYFTVLQVFAQHLPQGSLDCKCGAVSPVIPVCSTDDCFPVNNPGSEYYFNGCMSQELIKKYLAKAGFYNHPMACTPLDSPNEACKILPNTNCFQYRGGCDIKRDRSCVDEELQYLKEIGVKFIRTYGDWGGAEHGYFGEEKLFAQLVHCEVDPEIIIEAGIQEVVCSGLNSPGGGDPIQIPDYVKQAFGYTGPAKVFNYLQMGYDGVPPDAGGCLTPDISKEITKMWYYYVGTQFILHGYESIHMGNWADIIRNDPTHSHIWDVMCKMRAFAKLHARRKFVLFSGGATHDFPANNNVSLAPYLLSSQISNQFLFDFLVMTVDFKETYCVSNPNNPFYKDPGDPRLDRLIKLPNDFGNFSFGGIVAQPDCQDQCSSIQEIPYILHLDQGGNSLANADSLEGECTSNGPLKYLTWGWGGEITYMHFLSTPIRQQMISYLYYEIQKRSGGNGFFFMPIKQPLASHYFHGLCDGDSYFFTYGNCEGCETCNMDSECKNTKFICEKVKDPIRQVLRESDKYHVQFCEPTVIHQNFSAEEGWANADFPRFMMDVNNDGLLDIVGLGQQKIFVSVNNGPQFDPAMAVWGTTLTVADGWDLTQFRSYGDFNGDGKSDLIGIKNGNAWIGLSNGLNQFNFVVYNIGAPHGGEWFVGRFNNDTKDDLLWLSNTTGTPTVQLYINKGAGFNAPQQAIYNYPNINSYSIVKINNDDVLDIVGLPNGAQNNNETIKVGLIVNGTLPATLTNYGTEVKLDCMDSTLVCCGNFESSNCGNGWDPIRHARIFGDVDGDGDKDLILFGEEGVLVSKNLSPNPAFTTPEYWIYDFGAKVRSGGWNNNEHIRTVGDVNGDGMEDVVGFGEHEMFVMLSGGSYFISPVSFPNFADEPDGGGWDISRHIRMLVDFDNDKKVEIVGFGEFDVLAINCSGQGGPFFRPEITKGRTNETGTELNALVSAFPNPFFDLINVKATSDKEQGIEIMLYDVNGQVVSRENFVAVKGENQSSIKLKSGLPNGTYLLKVVFADGKSVEKVMLKM